VFAGGDVGSKRAKGARTNTAKGLRKCGFAASGEVGIQGSKVRALARIGGVVFAERSRHFAKLARKAPIFLHLKKGTEG